MPPEGIDNELAFRLTSLAVTLARPGACDSMLQLLGLSWGGKLGHYLLLPFGGPVARKLLGKRKGYTTLRPWWAREHAPRQPRA